MIKRKLWIIDGRKYESIINIKSTDSALNKINYITTSHNLQNKLQVD